MKIVFLADASNSHTKKWAKYFSNLSHNVHVITFLDATIQGVTIHHIRLMKSSVINHSLSTMATAQKMMYLLYAHQIKKLIHELAPDILHAHYATSYGLLGALSGYKPFLISVWGSDVFDFPQKSKFRARLVKWILSRATHVTATSHMMTNETRLYMSKDRSITTIPFGVNVDTFFSAKKKNKNVTIGIVKLLEEKYGVKYLIKAFAICVKTNPDLKLSIVGEGIQKNYLQNLCKELGISLNVTFYGHVDHALVPDYMRQMNIFVVPSILDSETFGVAAVEASACGLPVIASRIGGLPEVVKNEETGFLVEPGNVEQLAEKMQLLIDDPELREKLGNAGRQFVLENYDWSQNARLMSDVYDRFRKTN